jgi:hypothetical protein
MADDAEEGRHGQDVEDRRLVRRALHPGLIGEPAQAAPLVHVGKFKERDLPVFRGLLHEDVME